MRKGHRPAPDDRVLAVGYTNMNSDAPSRMELIFDPRTAERLGWNEVLVADSTVDVESDGPGAIYGAVGPTGTKIVHDHVPRIGRREQHDGNALVGVP